MNATDRIAKMTEILKAAGAAGITGAKMCERLGIAVDSAEADEAAHEFSRLPVSSRRVRNEYVFTWIGPA